MGVFDPGWTAQKGYPQPPALPSVEGVGGAGTPGPPGDDGRSAYEVAVANGFVGDEDAWLASLQGPPGDDGDPGSTGPAGPGVPTGGTTGQVLTKASSTNYDTSWSAPSSGGGGLFRYHPLGNGAGGTGQGQARGIYANTISVVGVSSMTMAAGVQYYLPFFAGSDMQLREMRIHVITGTASSVTRLGIYANIAGYQTYPGTLLWDTGTIDTGTSGVKTVANGSLNLTGGLLYWASVLSSASLSVRSLGAASALPIIGVDDQLATASFHTFLYESGTAASPLRETASTSSSMAGSTNGAFPAVWMSFNT